VPAWAETSEALFCDPRWQERQAVTNVAGLRPALGNRVGDEFYSDLAAGISAAPMAVRVTPYIVALIDWSNAYADPLRRQFLPLASELEPDHPALSFDSLSEQQHSPVAGLTHRYPDRALLLAVDSCPIYCRFCTRSYAVGNDVTSLKKLKFPARLDRWTGALTYVKEHPEIEDVVISGGDAYRLKPEQLGYLGHALLDIPHIRRFRVATKGLAIQPTKILRDAAWMDALFSIARRARDMQREVSIQTHFNHPNEITTYTAKAMKVLFSAGVIVRNQTVLLRGVNNDAAIMTSLIKTLSYMHVRPYYVYVCDLVRGVENLRTSLQEAIDCEKDTRGCVAGFNTPVWVVDTPGGGGKRDIHSFEHYDRADGISVFRAPAVKPGRDFLYFDPLMALGTQARSRWRKPFSRERMIKRALEQARGRVAKPRPV
jgi:lysine 2,3-aminomutase